MLTVIHLVETAGGVALMVATLPLALELIVLSLAAMLPGKKLTGSGGAIRLAVVIPAHNEEALIGKCVESLVGATAIYVVAHNCTDGTAERAEAAGQRCFG